MKVTIATPNMSSAPQPQQTTYGRRNQAASVFIAQLFQRLWSLDLVQFIHPN